MALSFGEEQLKLLECPVCLEPLYPPIFQCPRGHTICSTCKPSLRNSCPICREDLGDIRSLALEIMVASLILPCRYVSSGCTGVFKYNMKKQHEQECKFRPFDCPSTCKPCGFTAEASSLVEHLRNNHNSVFYQNCEIDELLCHDFPHADKDLYLNLTVYSCLGQYFCLHFRAFHSPSDMVYIAFLTFLGSEVDAINFRYRLEVGNDDEQLAWEGMPRSMREGVKQIWGSLDGLLIHSKTASSFAVVDNMEKRIFRVKGHIWREDN